MKRVYDTPIIEWIPLNETTDIVCLSDGGSGDNNSGWTAP